MEKKTALYDRHVEGGGKMVPFAGYLLPVQYTAGILKEHGAVRGEAGLFDVSHMGEFLLRGEDALYNLNYLLTNDFTDMRPGQARYSPMCYEDGGTVDDLLVYMLDENKYIIVVNAANRQKDFEWIQSRLLGTAELFDVSGFIAQLALQGPQAEQILSGLISEGAIPKQYYHFEDNCVIAGVSCLISRTGYTGEDGFELYCDDHNAVKLWDAIMEAGQKLGLLPCGLGARDTLRLEAGMPLYGHELSEDITPREANLSIFVKLDKPEFIGRDVLCKDRRRKRIGFVLKDKGIAREGAAVYGEGPLGVVSSGTMSPTLGVAIATAVVPVDFNGDEVEVDVRGRRLRANVVKLPFYRRENQKREEA